MSSSAWRRAPFNNALQLTGRALGKSVRIRACQRIVARPAAERGVRPTR
jgi:hypothetical protein